MENQPIPITDIFRLLEAIERWPGLFLLKNRLDYLYSFISGYKLLADYTNTPIENWNRFEGFKTFLQKELEEEFINTMGWFGLLHNRFGGGEEGLAQFFNYLHRFLQSSDSDDILSQNPNF